MGIPFRKLLIPATIVGGIVALAALPSAALSAPAVKKAKVTKATSPPSHREVVCHRTGSGRYIAIPPAKASSHITSDGEKPRGHEGDFIIHVTFPSGVKWNELKRGLDQDCNERVKTPAAPTMFDPCELDRDTYTIPSTAGVEYRVDGAVTRAGTHSTNGASSITITANAAAGYTLKDGVPTSWTFDFTNTPCGSSPTLISAPPPSVQEICGPNNDLITLPTAPHVTYTVSPTWSATSTKTVTATPVAGYEIVGERSWTFTDVNEPCPVRVTPSAPVVRVDPCETVNDTYEVPSQRGVIYQNADGDVIPAGVHSTGGALTVVVYAEAAEGYTLATNAQTVFTLTFTNVPCSTTPENPGTTPENPGGSTSGTPTPAPTPTPTPTTPAPQSPPAPPAAPPTGVAGLTVAKTGPATARLGRNIVYTLRVRNDGTATATNMVLVDRIPAGMVVVSKPAGAKVVRRSIRWNARTLAPGRTIVVRVVMRGVGSTAARRCNVAVASASNATTAQARACTNFTRVAGVTRIPRVTG